jgi:hypothetical protein
VGELAAAPVSRSVAVEPVRSSVLGAGKPANKPPAAVVSRPVVALRTPAPMPRSFGQQQAIAGGHLNQSSSLVRQEAPGRPVQIQPAPVTRQSQANDGFRSFGQPSGGTDQEKPLPRVWEAQGTPEPQKSAPVQYGNRSTQAAQRSSHPATPVAPVQQGNVQQRRDQEPKYSNWHQPATTQAHPQQNSHPAAQSQASSPKK